jgi:glycosyltransferase involved in cell wall biosynthesis
MRDPWTDIYYYKDLLHTSIAKNIDAKYEKKVLEGADALIVVSDAIKRTFAAKIKSGAKDKIHVIPNGYDERDFVDQVEKDSSATYITYVGTMADTYKPEIFFNAIKSCIEKYPEKKIKFRFVGAIPWTIKERAKELGIEESCEWIGHVDHGQAIQYMRKSDFLLLIIPDAPGAEGILTGKLFEYLGAGKPIIGIGPKQGDAARIIDRCDAGKMFERNESEAITQWMKEIISAGENIQKSNASVGDYERKQLTKTLTQVLIK